MLLFGTLCGGISLLADLGVHIAQLALGQGGPAAAAGMHSGGLLSRALARGAAASGAGAGAGPGSVLLSGPAICLAAVAFVLLPLCLLRRIRQLEGAATCGVAMVLALVGLLGYDAAKAGFPAVRDGSLPIWTLQVGLAARAAPRASRAAPGRAGGRRPAAWPCPRHAFDPASGTAARAQVDGHLPEAFSIIGYAFYMQPMMMPLVGGLLRALVGLGFGPLPAWRQALPAACRARPWGDAQW